MSTIRMLLSTSSEHSSDLCNDPNSALTDLVGHNESESHDSDSAFMHVYMVMLFIASLWFAGKLFIKMGMPALVGEIVFGILMGPHLLNLAGDPGSAFLIVIGEIGLVMLVVEAGIDVDVGMLKLIGLRGVAIAVMGSIIPMSFGFCISYLFMNTSIQSSIAIGACFAPTSMGIALNVLKKAKILNTPTGQLIIAAAILDDVIALIILSELQAMKDPSVAKILLPLIVSPILICVIGFLAIRYIPFWIKTIMYKVPKAYRENMILGLLFATTFAFVPMCHFLGSSYLLGAFLAGLCFCTDHTIHLVWHHQIKRVLQWMLRIFFAATIGFAIPIRDFANGTVIARGLIYCLCGIGKVVTGFFARPLTTREFLTVGFSMSAWGEFAFILATASFAEGTIDQQSFSAVLLAVLLSVILSPYALSFTIQFYEKRQQKQFTQNYKHNTDLHPLYFAINTKARGQWGHQDKLLHRIFTLGFQIIDFRSWHAPEYNHSHHEPLTKESFYVMDTTLALPPTKHLDMKEKNELMSRVKQIRADFREALGEKAVINIKRWLPGVSKKDDELEPTDNYLKAMFGGEDDGCKPTHKKTPEYCRTAAFKQAHSIMSVFERKNTLRDLARRSKASLHSMYSIRSLDDTDRKRTMEQFGNLMSLTNLFENDNNTARREQFENDMNENSITFSESPQPGKKKKTTEEKVHTGAGHGGRAGGAGAVPVSSSMINIDSHFEEEENKQDKQEKRDESYMSYIYGDEDSEHHKLPEYSIEHLPENIPFEPKLAQLAEDDENNKFDGLETSDQETDESKSNDGNSNKTLVSIDTPDTAHSNIDMDLVNKQHSSSSKLTIKIYSPALEAVASKSPVTSDMETPDGYLE